jgi:hypothetical protein
MGVSKQARFFPSYPSSTNFSLSLEGRAYLPAGRGWGEGGDINLFPLPSIPSHQGRGRFWGDWRNFWKNLEIGFNSSKRKDLSMERSWNSTKKSKRHKLKEKPL